MRKGTPVQIVNTSLNETLSRTLVTSLTTLLVLIAFNTLAWTAYQLVLRRLRPSVEADRLIDGGLDRAVRVGECPVR